MKKSYTEEQIIKVIKQHEAGAKVDDICRDMGISTGTFYNWRSKFAGLEVNEAKRLRDFNDLLAGDNPTDVDAESGGYSAKLDLARAYIEIDDFDSALQAVEDVIANGPEEVQEEAQSLKAKINE